MPAENLPRPVSQAEQDLLVMQANPELQVRPADPVQPANPVLPGSPVSPANPEKPGHPVSLGRPASRGRLVARRNSLRLKARCASSAIATRFDLATTQGLSAHLKSTAPYDRVGAACCASV